MSPQVGHVQVPSPVRSGPEALPRPSVLKPPVISYSSLALGRERCTWLGLLEPQEVPPISAASGPSNAAVCGLFPRGSLPPARLGTTFHYAARTACWRCRGDNYGYRMVITWTSRYVEQ